LNWWGLDNLPQKELDTLMKNNPAVLDYLVKMKDTQFLSKKTNWPKGIDISKEHLLDIIIGLQMSYTKIKSRINKRLDEDDYAYVYLEAGAWHEKRRIRDVVSKLFDDGYGDISKESKDLVEKLAEDDENRYDSFKSAADLFLF
jgi:hypothetical protein